MVMPVVEGIRRQAAPIQAEATRVPSPRVDPTRSEEARESHDPGDFIPESGDAGPFRLSDGARSLRGEAREFSPRSGTEIAFHVRCRREFPSLPLAPRHTISMTHPATPTTRPPLSNIGTRKTAAVTLEPAPSDTCRIQIGFDTPSERRRVLDWLGNGLRPERAGRLSNEYPILFRRNPSVFHVTLFDGPEPAAFAALWAVHVRVGVHRIRVGMVSLVYTDPAFRRRGFGRRVVEEATALAERLNLGLVLLWSERESFYSRLGFIRTGRESLLVLDVDSIDSAIRDVPSEPSTGKRLIEAPDGGDWAEIERIRNQRDCQLELNPEEFRSLRSIPDMSIRVARDATGIQAFAIRGRGDDFQEVIHEWGGSPGAVLECCRSLTEACEPDRETFLLCPPGRMEVPWALRRNGARILRKPLAWARIASVDALSDDLSRFLPGDPKLRFRRAGPGRDPEILVTSTRAGMRVSAEELLHLVLGSDDVPDDSGRQRLFASVLTPSNLSELPLPFFIWGLESI